MQCINLPQHRLYAVYQSATTQAVCSVTVCHNTGCMQCIILPQHRLYAVYQSATTQAVCSVSVCHNTGCMQRWLSEWRITINVSKSTTIIFARAGRRFIQPRPVTLFVEPIEWVDTTCYLGVTLDTRLSWSPHIDQVRKRTAQRMGMLGPLLNRKSDPSVRNGVLLYKQLIRPLMDYACPAWRSAARSHVRKL